MAEYTSTHTGIQLDATITKLLATSGSWDDTASDLTSKSGSWEDVTNDITSKTGSIEYTDSLLPDGGYCGTVINKAAGETIEFGDLCYIDTNGSASLANASSSLKLPALYLAVENIATDATGKFLRRGYAKTGSFSFTTGAFLYIESSSASGSISGSAPGATGANVQIIGIATDTDTIEFEPNMTLVELS